MITKFARLEFELFTKPSKSDFLRVHQHYKKDKKQIALTINLIHCNKQRQRMGCFFIYNYKK